MSTGAMGSAVSGLKAQSQDITARGDNIANSDVVGFKLRKSISTTLVTQSGSTTSVGAGGVTTTVRRSIDKQGTLENTGNATDISISGPGMFVVNKQADGSGENVFTRAGAFRQDNRGNFVNAAGFTLMGWSLDSQNRLPGEAGNITNTTPKSLVSSLEAINLKSISGSAAATTEVKLGITLDSRQDSIQGTGESITLSNNGTKNEDVGSQGLILPDSKINIGDKIHLNTSKENNNFTYGGLSYTKNFSGASTIAGAQNSEQTFTSFNDGDSFKITDTDGNEVSLTFKNNAGEPGEFSNMNQLADVINNNINFKARVDTTDDGRLYVGPEKANKGLTFANITATDMVGELGFFDIAEDTHRFNSKDSLQDVIHGTNSLRAKDASGTINFSADSPTTSLSTGATHGNVSWKAKADAGNTDLIKIEHPGHGLENNDIIYITDFQGTNGFENFGPAKVKVTKIDNDNFSIDKTKAYNNTPSASTPDKSVIKSGTNFKWQETVGNVSPPSAPVELTDGSREVKMYVQNKDLYKDGDVFSFRGIPGGSKDVSGGLTFSEGDNFHVTTTGSDGNGDFIKFNANNPANTTASITDLNEFAINHFHSVFTEFGLNPNKFNYGQAYHPDGGARGANFSEGADNGLQNFNSKALELVDSLGTRHSFRVSFGKLDQHKWAVEVHSTQNSDGSYDIKSGRDDGQVANGTLTFNTDGTLAEVSDSLAKPIQIDWANEAQTSNVTFDWGTAGPIASSGAQNPGKGDGMKQVATSFNKRFIDTNGITPGLLNSITIDQEGFVIAGFNNGSSKKVFKIPLAEFANPNGLSEVTGNAYTESNRSGGFNLAEASTGGMGKITSESLEQSNVDTSEEITGLIQANQTYQANTKVIKTETEKFEALNRVT